MSAETSVHGPCCHPGRIELGLQCNSDRFLTYILPNTTPKILAFGFDWVEGPVWFGDMEMLLFSDIPNNRIMCWKEDAGLTVFRKPSNFSNGLARDRKGRLLACEHGTRRVTRTEHDGTVTVLADSYEDKRLNSPNDIVVGKNNSIWFTDPHYGIATNYEGFRAREELPCGVYRIDPATGDPELMTDALDCPNGLAFNPEGTVLYISDTGRLHDPNSDPCIWRFEVIDGCRLGQGERFYTVDCGVSDGFRIDSDGNIWTSAGDGVHCINANGVLEGKIHLPETVANVTFGGRSKHVLFIAATTSIYAIPLNRQGIQHP